MRRRKKLWLELWGGCSWSNEKNNSKGPWLFVGYLCGDEILPSYVGIIVKHYFRIPMKQPVFHGK